MVKTKYKIGKRVKGINNIKATIVGIMSAEFFNRVNFIQTKRICPYQDPDWHKKYVYILEFDEATQQYTLEEFINFHKNNYQEDYLKQQWEKLDKVKGLTVPEYIIVPLDKENE